MRHADSIAYTFGQLGGLVKFSFSESERPDTHVDLLTIGFRTTQSDAVMAVVYSATSKDFVEVQLVSKVDVIRVWGSADNCTIIQSYYELKYANDIDRNRNMWRSAESCIVPTLQSPAYPCIGCRV